MKNKMEKKNLKSKPNLKNSSKKFYSQNDYECEKIAFGSKLDALNGIREDGDAIYLRPYKCNRCDNWHLTHHKERTLKHSTRPKLKTVRPCDVFYTLPKQMHKKPKVNPNKIR
jgi:hypothetical protein